MYDLLDNLGSSLFGSYHAAPMSGVVSLYSPLYRAEMNKSLAEATHSTVHVLNFSLKDAKWTIYFFVFLLYTLLFSPGLYNELLLSLIEIFTQMFFQTVTWSAEEVWKRRRDGNWSSSIWVRLPYTGNSKECWKWVCSTCKERRWVSVILKRRKKKVNR